MDSRTWVALSSETDELISVCNSSLGRDLRAKIIKYIRSLFVRKLIYDWSYACVQINLTLSKISCKLDSWESWPNILVLLAYCILLTIIYLRKRNTATIVSTIYIPMSVKARIAWSYVVDVDWHWASIRTIKLMTGFAYIIRF